MTDIGAKEVVDGKRGTRYAYGQDGRLCHAENAVQTCSAFSCVVCGDDVVLARSMGEEARFLHCKETTCTGRLPCELAPELIAELGDKPLWISFDTQWQVEDWMVRWVRLTWTGEGYLSDAEAMHDQQRIVLTGAHAGDPAQAIESIRALLDDIPRRLISRGAKSHEKTDP